jgi:Glycosyltransferase
LQRFCGLDPQLFATILNPVDRDRGRGPFEEPLKPGPRGKVVISVGRLEGVKNFKALLRAFAAVVAERKHRDDRLVILGEGYQRAPLCALAAELGIEEQLHLPGFRDNIYANLRAADLFVSTSLYEGLGNATLEAIAAGLPCILTETAGSQELAEHAGALRLVPQGNEKELSAAILEQLEKPSLTVSTADQEFIDSLTPKRVLESYLNVISAGP